LSYTVRAVAGTLARGTPTKATEGAIGVSIDGLQEAPYTSLVAAGESITIDGVTYIARATPTLAGEFALDTDPAVVATNLLYEISGLGIGSAHPRVQATQQAGQWNISLMLASVGTFSVVSAGAHLIVDDSGQGTWCTDGTAGDVLYDANRLYVCVADTTPTSTTAWKYVGFNSL